MNNSVKRRKGPKFEMKKQIGFWGAMSLSIGAIVGTGIFMSPVAVLRIVEGNVGISLIIWLLSGLFCLLSSLCYCELGTTFRASGDDYNNYKLTFGPVVAFIYLWKAFLIHPFTAATLETFSRHFLALVYDCHPPTLSVRLISILLLCILAFANCKSARKSVIFEIILSGSKFVALLVIGIGGIVNLIQGNPIGFMNFKEAFNSEQISQISLVALVKASYQGTFPYTGWNVLNCVTEEMKDVKRDFPKAMIFSLLSVIVIYLFVNIGFFSVLTTEEMLSSPTVGSAFANKILGSFAWFIPFAVCLSALGNLNGGFYSQSRLPFVGARDGYMPKILSMLHVENMTPTPTIIGLCSAMLFYIFLGDYQALVDAFGFISWTMYGLSATSLVILRWKMPTLNRPFKVPIVIPILVAVVSFGFVIFSLIQEPTFLYFGAIGFYLVAALAYYVFICKALRCRGVKEMTPFLQKLLLVRETEWKRFDYEKQDSEGHSQRQSD